MKSVHLKLSRRVWHNYALKGVNGSLKAIYLAGFIAGFRCVPAPSPRPVIIEYRTFNSRHVAALININRILLFVRSLIVIILHCYSVNERARTCMLTCTTIYTHHGELFDMRVQFHLIMERRKTNTVVFASKSIVKSYY